MKKIASFTLALTMALSLAACGSKPATTPATSTSTPAASTSTPAPTGDVIEIKVAHVEAQDRSTHVALEEMKTELESTGRFTVEIFPDASLGGDETLIEMTAMGSVQISLPSTSVLTMYNPAFGIMDMPFLFDSADSAFAAIDGQIGDLFDGYYAGTGLMSLGYSYNGARCMTNNVRPINTPADCAGIKFRTMSSQVFVSMFETLGANPTVMSFSEVFTGLQQNTIEGQENPVSLIYASGFHEVQNYLSLTNHVHNFLPVLVNEAWFTGLSAEDQATLQDAVATFVTNQRQLEVEDYDRYVQLIADTGVEVNEISADDMALFMEAVQPMYETYRAEFGEEVFTIADSYNG